MLTEGKTLGNMCPKKTKNNKRPVAPPPMRSQTYALAGPDNIVIAKGSSTDMHRLRKQYNKVHGISFRVWNAPSSKIGDKLR